MSQTTTDHDDLFSANNQPAVDELRSLVDELDTEELPQVEPVFDLLLETIEGLQDQIDDLEEEHESTYDIATTAVGKTAENESKLAELEATTSETRNIARTAVGKAQQVTGDPSKQEDAEQLPGGVAPSSSPLDFFANCKQAKVREVFVEESNQVNTYRAIAVAKRWPEFSLDSVPEHLVAFDRDGLEEALVAELGKKPHRQTVRRVWDKLVELGGEDIEVRNRKISSLQEETELLCLNKDTAEGLLEGRYVDLDILEESAGKTTVGGVTPVVMEDEN